MTKEQEKEMRGHLSMMSKDVLIDLYFQTHFDLEINQANNRNFAIEQLDELKKYFRSHGDCHTYTTYEVIHQLNTQINKLKENV